MTDKKTERLDVRVSYEKKQAFTEACEIQSDTPSNAIRRFVNSYIRRAKRDEAASGIRALLPRHAGKAAIALPLCLVAIIAIKPLFSNSGSDKIFAFYDYDKSGLIELGEIDSNDHHLHRVLNIDGKAGISPDEFIAKATMQWKLTRPDVEYTVETKKIGPLKITTSTSTSNFNVDDFPEGTLLFPADPEAAPISVKEFQENNMTFADLRAIDYQDIRAMGPVKAAEPDTEFPSHFVMFDLTDFAKPQINVLTQTSRTTYSKSMPFSRSVHWVEGVDAPHFVMGSGADKAVLAKP